jgi:squalene-hopene/tetraprenyl-beta-curcumene cyclase
MEYCSLAIDAVDSERLPQWTRFVQAFSDRIVTLHDDLKSARLQTVLRSQGFLNKEPHVLLADGIAVLEQDRARNYAEATHTMGFIWDTPDRQSHEAQSGSVFQRAIVADVLLDLDDCGLLNYRSASSGAVTDCEILLAERLKDVRGGWSYFPSLDNLPPDADDLAQVMQVLTRSQFRNAEVIEDALHLLFEHGSHGDGSFETWIVDPNATDPATSRYLHGIENYWGKGADVEVVSNLGFALSIHDPHRYAAEISAAAQYVESQQQDNGHWTPTWYASCWYGTYTATRFLASVAPRSDSLRISASLLPSEQKPDGGYGVASSTPLETALALLAIRSLAIQDEVRDKIHARARRYFQMSVRPDGSWDSSPFIQMDTHRASNGKPGYRPNMVQYGSRTLSTAYVVKALLVTDVLKKG